MATGGNSRAPVTTRLNYMTVSFAQKAESPLG